MDLRSNNKEEKMEHYYLCPKCRSKTLLPQCNTCGYEIPFINLIYRFCSDASVKLDGDKQYIGYDDIGEDFEPEVHTGMQTIPSDTVYMPLAVI